MSRHHEDLRKSKSCECRLDAHGSCVAAVHGLRESPLGTYRSMYKTALALEVAEAPTFSEWGVSSELSRPMT